MFGQDIQTHKIWVTTTAGCTTGIKGGVLRPTLKAVQSGPWLMPASKKVFIKGKDFTLGNMVLLYCPERISSAEEKP